MKKGFSSVFLVMILGSMILVSLAFAEVSASAAAESCAEDLCLLTGRSLLSEYKTELFDRYGIFMMRSYEDELSEIAAFYLRTDLALSSAALKMACTDVSVTTEMYPGLSTDLFLEQVRKLGALEAAENLIDAPMLREIIDGAGERLSSGLSASEVLDKLDELGASIQNDDSEGEERERIKQAKTLSKRLKEASKEGKTPAVSRTSIPASVRKKLPSAQLGVKGRGSLLFSGGIAELGAGNIALGEYILANCSDAAESRSDTYIKLETEYILYGASSDSLNQKLARNSLYALRFSLNLYSILTEPGLLSSVSGAAALFPLLPRTVTAAALTLIWTGIETKHDIDLLFEGSVVPLLKNSGDFATSLTSFIDKGRITSAPAAVGRYGSYRDYLRLLLLLLPEQEKAVRLMDVMEMNVSIADGASFAFRDYSYGFDLKAGFTRKRYLDGIMGLVYGPAYVEQTHKYK